MVNKLLPIIPTGNIMELNELIYAWAKLTGDKIVVLLRNPNKNTKLGREIRLEGQVKTLPQRANMQSKETYTGIC